MLPNHLGQLTFWNFEQTAGRVYKKLDWWEPRRGREQYSGAKVVRPLIVGFHGLPTTFLESSCAGVESLGTPVEPASLFESQLRLRTGALPGWMGDGQRRYEHFRATGRWSL